MLFVHFPAQTSCCNSCWKTGALRTHICVCVLVCVSAHSACVRSVSAHAGVHVSTLRISTGWEAESTCITARAMKQAVRQMKEPSHLDWSNLLPLCDATGLWSTLRSTHSWHTYIVCVYVTQRFGFTWQNYLQGVLFSFFLNSIVSESRSVVTCWWKESQNWVSAYDWLLYR